MNFTSMNKDELEAYALVHFGINLDKRKRLEDLQAQVAHYESKKMTVKKTAEISGERVPKFVRNIHTNVVWPWNPLYKGNADLEVIEWEPRNADDQSSGPDQ